jgi:hypothetical protein
MSSSYVILPDSAPHPLWPSFPDTSFFILPPPPEPDRADAYGALCWADDYLEAAKDALRAGDDDAARAALEVLAGFVAVVAGKVGGKSSENLRDTKDLH